MRHFVLSFFTAVSFASFCGENFPAPAPVDTSTFGWGIQRTMTLLATSTPEKRNTVRVLFYGQSITEHKWWKSVAEDLKARFPHANLIVENKAVGGFASQLLVRLAEHDAYPMYPDLVIFYVYGDHNRYDDIIRNLRSRTTAEVLMQTEHMAVGKDQNWPEMMSTKLLPEIAKKYGAELADVRTEWKKYLEANKLDAQNLLTDAVHFNDHGGFLNAELLKRHLRHDPKLSDAPWKNLVKDIAVGSDVKWDGGSLKVPFEGNRVDAIALANAAAGGKAKVLIDGKAPGEFPGAFYFTRPNAQKGFIWGGGSLIRVDSEKLRVEEEWTLTFTEISEKRDALKYTLAGSKTGPDGEGGIGKFVSKSGRVAIDSKDFHWGFGPPKPLKPGFQIQWSCKALFANPYIVPPAPPTGIENATTLIQGIDNGPHVLELISEDGKPLPIATIRVFSPPVKVK